MSDLNDQSHPQYRSDRDTVNQILSNEPTDFHLAELGRLIIRYKGFPGARDIQRDLEKALKQLNLTEDQLYEKTRAIHARADTYQNLGRNREDWS